MSKEVTRLTTEIEKSKKELKELISRFNSLGTDAIKFDDMNMCSSVSILKESVAKLLREYKDSLTGNKKYCFEFKEIKIEEAFGYFGVRMVRFSKKTVRHLLNSNYFLTEKFDSSIMDIDLQNKLVNLCEFPVCQKWSLKYRATRDGFNSKDFHSKCDGVPNTLTVIKTTCGNIFGGFTEHIWHSSGISSSDPNCFIYSLVNKENNLFKIKCSDCGKYAIRCHSYCGPSFGGDRGYVWDIYIASESNTNQGSYSCLGHAYKHPKYPQNSEKANSILAGSNYFLTQEIEVFTKMR